MDLAWPECRAFASHHSTIDLGSFRVAAVAGDGRQDRSPRTVSVTLSPANLEYRPMLFGEDLADRVQVLARICFGADALGQ